jgi:hypothetical protein
MRNVASYRMRRANEAIKEIIATALTHDLKDPRIGFVTLTGVEATPRSSSRYTASRRRRMPLLKASEPPAPSCSG